MTWRNSEVAGRAGKHPDGSAKTREAKVLTLWTAEARDDQGKPMRDPGSITYSAALESAAAQDANPSRSDFRRACTTRSDSPKLHQSTTLRGAGRWFCLDLEHRQGTKRPNHGPGRAVRNWMAEN